MSFQQEIVGANFLVCPVYVFTILQFLAMASVCREQHYFGADVYICHSS